MYLYIFAMTAGDRSSDLIGTDKEAGKLSFNSDWLALIALSLMCTQRYGRCKSQCSRQSYLTQPKQQWQQHNNCWVLLTCGNARAACFTGIFRCSLEKVFKAARSSQRVLVVLVSTFLLLLMTFGRGMIRRL